MLPCGSVLVAKYALAPALNAHHIHSFAGKLDLLRLFATVDGLLQQAVCCSNKRPPPEQGQKAKRSVFKAGWVTEWLNGPYPFTLL